MNLLGKMRRNNSKINRYAFSLFGSHLFMHCQAQEQAKRGLRDQVEERRWNKALEQEERALQVKMEKEQLEKNDKKIKACFFLFLCFLYTH